VGNAAAPTASRSELGNRRGGRLFQCDRSVGYRRRGRDRTGIVRQSWRLRPQASVPGHTHRDGGGNDGSAHNLAGGNHPTPGCLRCRQPRHGLAGPPWCIGAHRGAGGYHGDLGAAGAGGGGASARAWQRNHGNRGRIAAGGGAVHDTDSNDLAGDARADRGLDEPPCRLPQRTGGPVSTTSPRHLVIASEQRLDRELASRVQSDVDALGRPYSRLSAHFQSTTIVSRASDMPDAIGPVQIRSLPDFRGIGGMLRQGWALFQAARDVLHDADLVVIPVPSFATLPIWFAARARGVPWIAHVVGDSGEVPRTLGMRGAGI